MGKDPVKYRLVIYDSRTWRRDCNILSPKDMQRMKKRLGQLAEHPWPENIDVKKLQQHDIADFRLRIGDYRVLFNKNDEARIIWLLRVLHRSKAY